METRSKRKANGRSMFLQVALLMAALHVPTATGIDCYCSNAPSSWLPLCHWDGYTCSGDVCYVRRVLEDNGIIYTKWGCLRHDEHHIELICDDGAFNTDTEQYGCCTDSTNCNEHLEVILPVERPTSTTTLAPTTKEISSGSGEGDLVPSTGPRSTTTTAAMASLPVPSPSTVVSTSSTTLLLPKASISPSSSLPALPTLPAVSSLPLLPTSTPSPLTPDSQLLCSCSDCVSGTVACGAGGSCYVRVDSDLQQRRDNGLNPQPLSWGCMNATESMKKCEGSPEQYKCCASGDFCNQELLVSMTDQPTVATTASNGCMSGDCQSLDKFRMIVIAVVVAVTLTLILTLLVLLVLVLSRIRSIRDKRIPVSTEGSSRSDSRVNSVSTELDSVNGNSPTSKSSPHHLLHVQVITHVCEKEHVFGDSDNCST